MRAKDTVILKTLKTLIDSKLILDIVFRYQQGKLKPKPK